MFVPLSWRQSDVPNTCPWQTHIDYVPTHGTYGSLLVTVYLPLWASYQIRKIAGCARAGNAGNVSPTRRLQRKPLVSDAGMHHGTCVTHVPWCMLGSLTCGGGENVPVILGACAPAILRIWQEAHTRYVLHKFGGYQNNTVNPIPKCMKKVSVVVIYDLATCSISYFNYVRTITWVLNRKMLWNVYIIEKGIPYNICMS